MELNGVQAAIHVRSLILDVASSIGALLLRAGLNKTYSGITWEDVPLYEVLGVLGSRLTVDLLYWKRTISPNMEFMLTLLLWLTVRRALLWKKETWQQTGELFALTIVSMLAISAIMIKL